MNAPAPTPPRRRLQELLSIPERIRTDAEWDEINELEISLAPGNRVGGPDPNRQPPRQPSGKEPNKPNAQPRNKPIHKRRSKPAKPAGTQGPKQIPDS